MTLIIELTPTEEARLTAAARQAGMAPTELARQLVTAHLPIVTAGGPEDPTLALFAQWDADDAQMTPEEVTEAQRDHNEFIRRMNTERARAGARILYP
jgi:hypothetical protein